MFPLLPALHTHTQTLHSRPVTTTTQIWPQFVLSDEKFTEQGFKWGSLAGGGESGPSAQGGPTEPLCISEEKAAFVRAMCDQLFYHSGATVP